MATPRSATAAPGRSKRWGFGDHFGTTVIEERHGCAAALRALGVWGPFRGPHENGL